MTREDYYKMPLEWNSIKEPQSKILIDKIYDDFESRICENCKWYQTHTYQSALGTKETESTVTRCQKHRINWGKDFGCVDFVSTDTKANHTQRRQHDNPNKT